MFCIYSTKFKFQGEYMTIHVVTSGDTLWNIAERYGVTVEKLVADNQISMPDRLAIGQNIVVDVDEILYTIYQDPMAYH